MLKHTSTSDLKIKAGKPPKQTLVYLAPSVGSFTLHGGSDRDEGFRIFYSLHEHLHLWAWDARTFAGHAHAH